LSALRKGAFSYLWLLFDSIWLFGMEFAINIIKQKKRKDVLAKGK
jgi:hypothetical protein